VRATKVATTEFVLATGRISAFLQLDSGPTVLLIHGNSSCKEIFVQQLATLCNAGYGVLVPDLPGHGASSNARRASHDYSFPGYAAVIRLLLDELAIAEVHILGWSLGGHIGLELLATEKRVRSLMITGTPPIKPGPNVVEEAFLSSPAMGLTGKRVLTRNEVLTYGTCMVGSRRFLNNHLVSAIRRTDGNARHWMVKNGLGGVGTDEAATVRKSTRPLAVVHGTRDVFINPDYLKSLKYRALWRKTIQFLDAGHAPHWQRPRLFNKLLLQFLEETRA